MRQLLSRTAALLRGSAGAFVKAGRGLGNYGPQRRSRKIAAVGGIGLLGAGAALIFAIAQNSPPAIPALDLAAVPLVAVSQGDKPTMALALSVEYPTVGAQYMPPGSTAAAPIRMDASYDPATEYIGYYDANSCYTYNNAPTEGTSPDYKRFVRSGATTTPTSHKCANAFSGNFMNWATSSAVDMMRMALSGGDRFIDTPSLTVLQRAVLPDGTLNSNGIPCFFNSNNFPGKKLLASGGGAGQYFGAIPQSMITLAGGKNVYVGNILDRVYFGAFDTAPAEQDCSQKANYKLGAGTPGPAAGDQGPGPYTLRTGVSLPPADLAGIRADWSDPTWAPAEPFCADGTTGCSDYRTNSTTGSVYEVWYGSGTNWSVAVVKDYLHCTSAWFGNPNGNAGPNACYLRRPPVINAAPVAPATAYWPPPGQPGLNSEGYFFARVEVCDKSGSALADVRDYGLCKPYGANFKPTGAIQKYADNVRLAAFGYAMDLTRPETVPDSSFGGVLRAPMKYVGSKTFDDNGVELAGVNTRQEWDTATGVFTANPEGDTTYNTSGVINYLNKFGRTGATPGRYKIYDPVSELHYEVLRYLQGKAPSQLATTRLIATPSMADGFPAYTSWTDPYGGTRSNTGDYSCQKASIVVVGDINTNDPATDRFNRPTVDGPADDIAVPDIVSGNGWRAKALAFEPNNAMTYIDGAGTTRTTNRTPTALNPLNSNARYSPMIGTAYWARSHDIRPQGWSQAAKARPGLRVKSFFFDVNEWGESAGAAKDSFRRQRNQFFTAAKYGGYNSDIQGGNTWGNPFKRENGADDEDVWQKTDTPGEAKSYYLAEDARKVLRAFDDIFKEASTSARSIAGAAVSNTELTTAGGRAYQGAFNTEDWSGDVLALPVNVDSAGVVSVGTVPAWQASARLTNMTSPVTNRTIIVGRSGSGTYPTAVAANPPASTFTWAAIDSTLQGYLNKSPSGTTDTRGSARMDFLKGDRSLEGSEFRSRSSLLGDIVNSGVTFMGTPTSALTFDSTYTTFYNANRSRQQAAFVGANDGMLHAFDAATGDELFAYMPSWMGPKLVALTDPAYVKQAYVDATPAVGEAQLPNHGGWKTVLASGTGGGGRGVFALDVTDATHFSVDKVLWEFTERDDWDMGYVIGKPQIVKMRTTTATDPSPQYKWFVMVASGVNNYVPDSAGLNFSTTGKPALFLLSLDKLPTENWRQGTNYFKVSLRIDGSPAATGLVNFRPIFGAARQVTVVYAGDLHGNMWRLDFAKQDSTNWTIDKLSTYNDGSESSPLPLFVSAIAGVRQPIVMAPSVSAGPASGGVQTAYIAFGTGRYLTVADKTSVAQNSIYVVLDPGQAQTGLTTAAISGRGRLQAGTVGATTVVFPAFTWGLPTSDTDTSARAGFYFDFVDSGERQVSNAVIKGDLLVFGSLNPTAAGSTAACGPGRGGNEYSLNIDTGNGTTRRSTVGLLGEPLVLDLIESATYTTSDTTGRRTKTVVSQVLQQGSNGLSPGGRVTTRIVAGRLSWRQIANYQDIKNTP